MIQNGSTNDDDDANSDTDNQIVVDMLRVNVASLRDSIATLTHASASAATAITTTTTTTANDRMANAYDRLATAEEYAHDKLLEAWDDIDQLHVALAKSNQRVDELQNQMSQYKEYAAGLERANEGLRRQLKRFQLNTNTK